MDTERFLTALAGHSGVWCRGPGGAERSYRDLVRTVERNMAVLRRFGISARNGRRAGRPAAALNVSLGPRSVPVLLAAFGCRIPVAPVDLSRHPSLAKKVRDEVRAELLFDDFTVDAAGGLRPEALPETTVNREDDELEDVALVLYTSGTTGHPKGVMLTYDNIWSNLADILHYWRLTPNDRMLLVRPLTHASAITGELLPALHGGCEIAMKPAEAGPLGALRGMEEQRATILCATPTLAAHFAVFASRYDLSSVRRFMLSGEPILPAQLAAVRSAFASAAIGNAYGLTEASPRVSCKPELADGDSASNAGFPLRQVRTRIVDERGSPVEDGARGILQVAGPNVMKGYFGDGPATAAKLADGWLTTSDWADFRDGQLHVYGRADDMIIRAGVNVHPAEIEAGLLGVDGVREALAFGRREPGGVRVQAWIVAGPERDPEAVVRDILRRQDDARLWVDAVEVKRSLPRTPSGKLIRPKMEAGKAGDA